MPKPKADRPAPRHKILLRAAYDLAKRASDSRVVLETEAVQVMYDGANCDGGCLMEDIADVLGIDPATTDPIPLNPED